MLKCLKALLSEGDTITPSTSLCDWCYVMCLIVFGDMNNLYNLGVILCVTRVLSLLVLGL
jgi:hypothetical protein